MRDGFVDVDSGGMDSLKDIRSEFEKSQEFSVARTRDEADNRMSMWPSRSMTTRAAALREQERRARVPLA
jgi:hypothetical protein